jgi:hypothetical protein
MSYTTPPQFEQSPQQPPRREVDFQVLSEAFNLLLRHWQVYVIPGLMSLLLLLPMFFVAYAPLFLSMVRNEPERYDPFSTFWLQQGLGVGAQLFMMVVNPGVCRYTMNVVRGLPASSSDVWYGFKNPLAYIAIGVFTIIATYVGLLACCIGALFVQGLLMFSIPIKVDTSSDPLQSMGQSWSMLKEGWLLAGVFWLVCALISGLGALACGIGVILTMPFMYVASTMLYCQYVGHVAPRTSDPVSPYPRG